CGLSTAERTGSPIFHTLWSYYIYGVLLARSPGHQLAVITGKHLLVITSHQVMTECFPSSDI
ncbi:hypothetical protein ACN38_g13126, partial [Penicillium nordicum]